MVRLVLVRQGAIQELRAFGRLAHKQAGRELRGVYSRSGAQQGHPLKVTGAIYDLQAPSGSTQVQVGAWNNYLVEANGPRIRVTLNGQLVNDYQSARQQTGYLALQAHDSLSRTQFRNLQVQKLP
jgi:3-keto-disaccharide hydrolase